MQIRFRCAIAFAILIALASSFSLSAAQVPTVLNYQGKLHDAGGNPITTYTPILFSLWNAPAGGDTLWSELRGVTPDGEGLFTILLGSVTPIPDSAFDGTGVYLAIKVAGDPEMSPRLRMASVPFAFRSPGGGGGGGSDDWTLTGNVLSTNGPWGLVRSGSSLAGTHDSTHVNFGVASTAGMAGPSKYATVSGGLQNSAGSEGSTVSGGSHNTALRDFATVSGGDNNLALGYYATVSGGQNDTASGLHSVIGGGYKNVATGDLSTIAGGKLNRVGGYSGTVGGGMANYANGMYATASGGALNLAVGIHSVVSGGRDNDALGDYSTVAGGFDNVANSDYSFAAGRRAKANGPGTFVWADSTDADFESPALKANQFLIRADNVGIGTATPSKKLEVAGSIKVGANDTVFTSNLSSNSPLVFQAPAGTPRLYISDGSGNVGVGTQTPANRLDVEGAVAVGNSYSGTAAAPPNGLLVEGSLGIGTTTPTKKLEVAGSIKVGTTDTIFTSNLSSTSPLVLQAPAGTARMYISDASGSVGIGTTTPSKKLEVAGSIKVGTTDTIFTSNLSSTSPLLLQAPAGTARMYISDGSGNVGIGTMTPANRLDVEGGLAVGSAYSGSTAAPANGLLVEGNAGIGTTTPVNKLDIEGAVAIGTGYSGSSAGPANGLLVEGSVGIGTATPAKKLDVAGSIQVRSTDTIFANTLVGSIPVRIQAPAGTTRLFVNSVDGRVGVGTETPTSRLHVAGALATTVTTGGGLPVTLTEAHSVYLANNGSVPVTVSLPNAIGIAGRQYTIKKISLSPHAVTVAPVLGQTIDGATSYALSAYYKYVTVVSDGANWFVIGNN